MGVLDRLVCNFAGDGFAFEDAGVEVKVVEGIALWEMVSLRCGAEEEVEEGKDANGGQDDEEQAAVGDTRLGGHLVGDQVPS